jgi:exoribonuclease R
VDNWDFISSNTDSDESGVREEMGERYTESIKSVNKEVKRIYLKNAIARGRRKRNDAHKLIEESILIATQATAKFL